MCSSTSPDISGFEEKSRVLECKAHLQAQVSGSSSGRTALTVPRNTLPGKYGTVRVALWPEWMAVLSAASKSAVTQIVERSATAEERFHGQLLVQGGVVPDDDAVDGRMKRHAGEWLVSLPPLSWIWSSVKPSISSCRRCRTERLGVGEPFP